jgi:hypothetical protein
MVCVVVYPGRSAFRARVLKGRLTPKPRRWKVTVWYDVGTLDEGETNPRSLVVEPDTPVWLHDISGLIEAALRDDAANCGGVTNVRWRAETGASR